MRKKWDNIWMDLAISLSERSTDVKHLVGCVIVTEDNTQVLSIGYNGDHKGGTNKRISLESGKSGFIHAENNALIKCDFNNLKGKKMYVTLSPCYACSQLIINFESIKTVYYLEKYCDKGLKLLNKFGIQTIKIH